MASQTKNNLALLTLILRCVVASLREAYFLNSVRRRSSNPNLKSKSGVTRRRDENLVNLSPTEPLGEDGRQC